MIINRVIETLELWRVAVECRTKNKRLYWSYEIIIVLYKMGIISYG